MLKISNNKNKDELVLNYIIIVCTILLSFAYLTWLLGSRYFNLPEISMPFLDRRMISYLVELILFQINILFMHIIIFGIPDNKKELLLSFIALPINILFYNYDIFSFVMPFIYFAMICIYKKQFKNYILKFISFVIISILYTYFSMLVKTNNLYLVYSNISTFNKIMYSIDLFIFYTFLYYKFNRRKNNASITTTISKLEDFGRKSIKPIHFKKQEEIILKDYNVFYQVYIITYVIGIQLLQLLCIIFIGYLNNSFYEVLFLIPTLIILRTFILKETLHAKYMSWCTIISCVVFYIMLNVAPPLNISMFCGIALTSILVLFMYYIATNTIDIHEMDKDQLFDYCRKNNLNIIQSDIVYYIIIEKLKDFEIYEKLNYSKSQYYVHKKTIKRLGINIK